MSDTVDDWKALRAQLQAARVVAKLLNLAALSASGLSFQLRNGGDVAIFRDAGRAPVNFYPPTGRWHFAGTRKMHGFGAVKFIEWYQQQTGESQ